MAHPVHLILSAGTRIVTRNDVNRIGGGSSIAAGAVAVIIESPSDAQHAYKVQFNDGIEAMVRRSEFSILKEFKEVVHGHGTAPDESSEFEQWEPYIIYRCIVGSQAFGLTDGDSDVDRRGIYLPPAELHWSLYSVPEQINPHRTGPDADNAETYWELQKFLIMALKANPNILECLHTPLVEYRTPLAEELLANRQRFLSKLIYQTYNGYVMSQFKKLEQDLRARGEIRWKHAMHLIRLLLSGITALEEGRLRIRLDEHREELLRIKRGEQAWSDVNAWRLRLHRQFDKAFASTQLPERPDYNWAKRVSVESATFESNGEAAVNTLSQERWASLWRCAQAKGDPLPWYERLATAYAEPHRHYHDQRHIAECLREFDAVRQQSENPQALEFALWFHDAVYDPKASDNEEKSADLAAHCLADAKLDRSFSERVQQCVMATKMHELEPGTDLALMIDIDLAILGSSWVRFSEYEQAIQGEYAWVPADVFCSKRATILEKFLARDRIYSTEWFQRKCEQQARENLAKSIQNLKGPS